MGFDRARREPQRPRAEIGSEQPPVRGYDTIGACAIDRHYFHRSPDPQMWHRTGRTRRVLLIEGERNMYFDHHLDGHDPTPGALTLSYLVCATPRSGSSLLCELLYRTGVAGAPTEYFDAEHMSHFERRWGTANRDDYIEALRARTTTPNGVFGVKSHFDQMIELFGASGVLDAFPNLRAMRITRDDIVAQAVSYSIAMQTGRWASTHSGNGSTPRYRPDVIEQLAAQIEHDDRRWSEWLSDAGITPLVVRYEALVEEPRATLDQVLRALGVSGDLDAAHANVEINLRETRLQRQRTLRSRIWAERYRRRSR